MFDTSIFRRQFKSKGIEINGNNTKDKLAIDKTKTNHGISYLYKHRRNMGAELKLLFDLNML